MKKITQHGVSSVLFTTYYFGGHNKKDEMSGTCSMHEGDEKRRWLVFWDVASL
jgi:hypothetical protein